ncbi:hypothetical protein FS749_015246 [Ceratobasidium sp. UAMH 11750]|nr:hypothetical protein FS749_015246 [Ceratobasidium sp. UAMH 11750]
MEEVRDESEEHIAAKRSCPTTGPLEMSHPTASNKAGPSAPASKRQKVATEAPDESEEHPHPSIPSPSLPRMADEQLRRYKGVYIEDYPDPLAGSPISKECVPPPDLDAYMKSVGDMAKPKVFEGAELLMTSGMPDVIKERHLKSSFYDGHTPWCTCREMLADVDKLAHGPDFELSDFDVFDGRQPRPQYMVLRDIIHVMRDVFANPSPSERFGTSR